MKTAMRNESKRDGNKELIRKNRSAKLQSSRELETPLLEQLLRCHATSSIEQDFVVQAKILSTASGDTVSTILRHIPIPTALHCTRGKVSIFQQTGQHNHKYDKDLFFAASQVLLWLRFFVIAFLFDSNFHHQRLYDAAHLFGSPSLV